MPILAASRPRCRPTLSAAALRIIDYCHAAEHLHEAADAIDGAGTSKARASAQRLKDQLWNGRVDRIIAALKRHAERLGPPRDGDVPDHPRRVLAHNVGYFEKHRRVLNIRPIAPKAGPSVPVPPSRR